MSVTMGRKIMNGDVVYVRYGSAVASMSEAISLLLNKVDGVYVRVNNEVWENGVPIGVTLIIGEK